MSDLLGPQNTPFVDKTTNLAARDWFVWFSKVYQQVGGPGALSNMELTAQNLIRQEEIVELDDRMGITESDVNVLQIGVANLANVVGVDIDELGNVSDRVTLEEAITFLGLWNHV